MTCETTFEELDKTRHDRESFDCGGPELNDFLKTKALEYLWKVNTFLRAWAVVVDCLTDTAKPFYEKYGFRSLGIFCGHEGMFIPMKTVEILIQTVMFFHPETCTSKTVHITFSIAATGRSL